MQDFGRRYAATVQAACGRNPWFMPCDVERAAKAICDQMLDRKKIRRWLSAYDVPAATPRNVAVIMAGNIPMVGFFDMMCVVAAGHRALVKPSGKDEVTMRWVVETLRGIEPAIAIDYLTDDMSPDAVIATGSDNTNRYFRARYGAIPHLLRGSRHSIAVLSGCETAGQLAALSQDIFSYSGLGCRSVSLIFAPRGYEFSVEVPPLNDEYINNYRQTRTLLAMNGVPFADWGGAVVCEDDDFPLELSRINVARYDTPAQVERWIESHDTELQCIVSECIEHPRCVGFGRAQYPSLTDYADARDVMEFLCGL